LRRDPLWLEGVPTKDLVDDQEIVLMGQIKVQGTKSYSTVAGGSKTIRRIRFLGPKEIAELEQKAAVEAEDSLYRTWRSADGQHTTVAKFLKFDDGRVHLQNREGKVVILKSTQLSSKDRQHLRNLVKAAKQTKSRKNEGRR
jgi:hypothetical protein